MVDYMEEPLRKTLRDESPYVRKTAAICVAKLFDLNPTMCIENGFLETLQELIGDPNPMVVANLGSGAVGDHRDRTRDQGPYGSSLPTTLKELLMALNECTEWGAGDDSLDPGGLPVAGRKGIRAHLREGRAAVPTRQPQRGAGRRQGGLYPHAAHQSELVRQYLKKMAPPLGKEPRSRPAGCIPILS